MDFDDKIKEYAMKGHIVPDRFNIKTPREIEAIKESAKVNTGVLDHLEGKIVAGMSTEDINKLVHNYTIEHDAIPAPLNYEGFPKSCCTSINNEVCHGIPSEDIILKDGDIINVDVSTIKDGYFSDASRMYMVGQVSEEAKNLVEVTKECLNAGLDQVKPWGHIGDIGAAIQEYAESRGYSVVTMFGGHGIGNEFHEEPFVSHVGRRDTGMLMVPGMVFTIEPMINMGTKNINQLRDGWTILTRDGKPSAHFEHDVALVDGKPKLLSTFKYIYEALGIESHEEDEFLYK